jgi:hypothetical protein
MSNFLKTLLFLLITAITGTLDAQNRGKSTDSGLSYTDPKIHTVLFFTEGWEFSMPVIDLGSSQRLVCKFDQFSADPKSYRYALVHCDADWSPSRVVTSEYMDGFPDNPVNDYDFSINTTIPFVNYRLFLPNENANIKLSGNYLLKIWEDGNKENPVLVRPFYVTEKVAEIAGQVQKASFEGYNGASQQLAFIVNFPPLTWTDPLNEIRTVVMQNQRYDNRLPNLKPTYIRQNQLVYEDNFNLFKGGNEFRNFDAKNLQTNGMGVHSIEFRDPYFHLFLEKDFSMRSEIYRTRNDLNGSYLVKNDRAGNSDLESDYVYVHFSLTPPDLVTNDQIYVFGALTDWQCLPYNQMNYQSETKSYDATILLKQGFYDYQYARMDKTTGSIDATALEGSHVQTENDYRVFVYYRGFSSRYDRLIGYKVFSSVK